MKNKEFRGYALVFIAGALWGVIGPFIRLMENAGSTSYLTSFLRMAFAFIIMAVITIAKFGIRAFRIDKKTLLFCALLGLVCHGIYNVFYSIAVSMAGITIGAVLLDVAPVFTAVISAFLFRERITLFKVFALIINVIGCILAATGGSIDFASASFIGLLCGIAAGFCYSLTAIFGRLAGNGTNPFIISVYSYFFAAVFLGAFLRPWQGGISLNAPILIYGFLYALIPTAIAYLLYYRGVQNITESSKIPVIASIETVMAALIGVFAFSENLNIINIIGIILTLISIALMQSKRSCKSA